MLNIPSYIRVKKKYQNPVDYIILISLILFLIFLIYFIYFKINFIYYFLFPKIKTYNKYFDIQPHNGKDELILNYTFKQQPIHSEYNYSICGFIYIKNWKYRYYQSKSILAFKNQSLPNSISPLSIVLNKQLNDLVFHIQTSKEISTFAINNIDINKWFHFAIVVKDLQVELYYNGKIYGTYILKQLPKPIQDQLIICDNDGFDGLLYSFMYFQKYLRHKEILELTKKSPPTYKKYFKD